MFSNTNRFRICDAFGIPVYLDLSLLILLGLFVWEFEPPTLGIACALVLAVSITLHELGHALTARAFGYQTHDITLSLLGGCASLVGMPRKAYQEFLVALAGPLVSFALSGIGWATLRFLPIENFWLGEVISFVLWMNLILGGFNLLPGFPMDGGRIFRSVLRFVFTRARATYAAMVVGRVAAVLLVLGPMLGVTHIWIIPIGGSFILRALIAWMIWQAGYREYLMVLDEERFMRWTQADFEARVSPPPYDA